MILVRKSDERGHFNYGWLDTYHTFSFADYLDPAHMGFRSLRVINEDRVEPGRGFDTHGHKDMEIITYVLQGLLEHKDSLGNGSLIKPGEIQRMSAGTGVRHSEKNPSLSESVHLLQIWILPERAGLKPSYEQRDFQVGQRTDRLCLVASREHPEAVTVHQDVQLYAAFLSPGKKLKHDFQKNRYGWVQIARGSVRVNDGPCLDAGDGAAISTEPFVTLQAVTPSEVLLFDLA